MTDRHHLLVCGGTFAAVGDSGDISGVRGGNSPAGPIAQAIVAALEHLPPRFAHCGSALLGVARRRSRPLRQRWLSAEPS